MSKAKIIVPVVLLLVLGVGYTMMKPKKTVKMKIQGTIYAMPQSFLLNLEEGHYAKLSVALDLAPGQSDGASATASSSSSEGPGTLPEEPVVREIVTNVVTGQTGSALVSDHGREAIKHQILADIRKQTDVKVEAVLLPEVTVQ
ncbi:MAG TPA: flagellar basal body-associated FliL family protein [Solirubrobacteraceae bacterium]|jgi:flagellar basal body-associated protein FliL|nr:flagellar basal body-associated FliL family protein [Solirubrobacteraceae bacterium]